ncbi:hypothetical protein CUZ93_1997 [Enterococcus xinjiangensis]|nr:hypothetical protein [Enterococcus lactis]
MDKEIHCCLSIKDEESKADIGLAFFSLSLIKLKSKQIQTNTRHLLLDFHN